MSAKPDDAAIDRAMLAMGRLAFPGKRLIVDRDESDTVLDRPAPRHDAQSETQVA